MEIAVTHPAFTTRKLHVRSAGFWSGPKVLVDGRVAEGKRGVYQIPDNTGKTREIKTKYSLFDPIPVLELDGEKIHVARQLTWYEYTWMGIPILLLLTGGALGGAFGFAAIYSSARIFRSERSVPAKYVLSGLISVGAALAFFVAAGVIHILVYGVPKQ